METSNRNAAFWLTIGTIACIGLISWVARQDANLQRYGRFGGYAHYPGVWIGGFTVYPGYIAALVSSPRDGFTDVIIAIVMSSYYFGTLLVAFCNRKKWYSIFLVSYVVSLGLNVGNFVYLGLLHI